MGIASWEGPGSIQGEQAGQPGPASSAAPADPQSIKARRAWLVGGIRVFTIDPRRRRGGHGHARRFLAADRGSVASPAGVWREWVSALQRHTVNSGLARLSAEERQVVTLAYLEGRTNRQIAEMLGVSVSTVRRRLIAALERIDVYVRNSGIWLSSILLIGLAHVAGRGARIGRLSTAAGSTGWTERLVAAVAVGTLTVAAMGVAGGYSHQSASKPSPRPLTAQSPLRHLGLHAPSEVPLTSVTQPAGLAVLPEAPAPDGVTAKANPHVEQPAATLKRICHGNPTNAPPVVPVGPRPGHPAGPPVSHPAPGGCGHAAAQA